MGDVQPKPFVISDDLVLSSLREAETVYRGSRGGTSEDGVLAKLRQVEELYRQFQARWENQVSGRLATEARLAEAEESIEQLAHSLDASRRQLAQERERAAQQRERARHLTTLLKDINRSQNGGNVYELILKACLAITGATRGLYVTARDRDDPPRIRAAIDVDGYPQAPPSEFIRAISRTVLERNDTLVGKPGDLATLPEPVGASEGFRSFLAAPVVLLNNINGIIIVADKLSGEFAEDDTETLLSVGDQTAAAVENAERQRALEGAYFATIGALAGAMETNDPRTHGSGEEAARYAALVAARLGLPEEERPTICYAALLHDIGKSGVSDGILHKPGPLLPEEGRLVRSHARLGADLIATVPALEGVARVVRHHHEWYDGGGYPDGLRDEAIPIAARIVGAVDAYTAMRERRSYREALTDEAAREELRRGAGGQFDPRVVDALLAVLDAEAAGQGAGDEQARCGPLPGFGRPREG